MNRRAVEVFIQERGARTRRLVKECRVDELPKIGGKLSVEDRNFIVMEKKNLLSKRGKKKAVPGILLIVYDFDALSW